MTDRPEPICGPSCTPDCGMGHCYLTDGTYRDPAEHAHKPNEQANEQALRDRVRRALRAYDTDIDTRAADAVIDGLRAGGYVIVPASAVEPASYESPLQPTPYNLRRLAAAKAALREAIRCRCETLHGHCYASGCTCPNHAEEVGR